MPDLSSFQSLEHSWPSTFYSYDLRTAGAKTQKFLLERIKNLKSGLSGSFEGTSAFFDSGRT